mmetsp:Transcript_36000/g.65936  ORF Transcript_36000/g.65936 Transcript_36000/m.65936 type:complete len:213 (+) Transcript_36000:557-1195(+)
MGATVARATGTGEWAAHTVSLYPSLLTLTKASGAKNTTTTKMRMRTRLLLVAATKEKAAQHQRRRQRWHVRGNVRACKKRALPCHRLKLVRILPQPRRLNRLRRGLRLRWRPTTTTPMPTTTMATTCLFLPLRSGTAAAGVLVMASGREGVEKGGRTRGCSRGSNGCERGATRSEATWGRDRLAAPPPRHKPRTERAASLLVPCRKLCCGVG